MSLSETNQVGIDETIGHVERLYRALTGASAPPSDSPYAPIPAEKDPVRHVEEQMGRLLDLLGQARPGPAMATAWTPPLTVWEGEDELLVCLDLPGLKREQVEVAVQGETITVSGARPAIPDFRLRASECAHGPFRRTLILPFALRGAEPAAQMKDGVLEIRVPKPDAKAVSPRPVPVH
jgi:HSP20 family protein